MNMNSSSGTDIFFVEVFASRPLQGNPLAVCLNADRLSDAQMQGIARQLNLSEVAFVCKPTRAGAHYRTRIFTPQVELGFAGHPTLGTAFVVAQYMPSSLPPPVKVLVQQTRAGLQRVEKSGPDSWWSVLAPTPRFTKAPSLHRFAKALGLAASSIVAEPLTIDVGVPWHVVLVDGLRTIQGIRPDFASLATFDRLSGACTTVFSLEAHAQDCLVHTRSFAPSEGILEDPVCGSGNAAVGAYMSYFGILPAPTAFFAEQGSSVGRDGKVGIRTSTHRGKLSVEISGQVLPLISGRIHLPQTT